jgi:hypothetical protein
MPAGDDVTVPLPEPDFVMPSANVVVVVLNLAVTVRACDIVTVQAPVPLHAPLQFAKVEPLAADAVNVTAVPLG